MPRTIEEGFSEFLAKLRATAVENDAAKSHRASIEACLRNRFGLIRFARIGSFGNGTNISGFSDVDYIACFPRAQLTETSNATLAKIKAALDARFPYTGVAVRFPTVTVPFGTYRSEHTEIVPARYLREANGCSVYEIPDGNNGWMQISPDAHNQYVARIDAKHNGRVKPLIRYVKAWKYFCNVPISSFYLEMWVARYADNESAIVYDLDIQIILGRLAQNFLPRVQDPTGVGGYIVPCSTAARHDEAVSKLATAVSRVDRAVDARMSGNTSVAFDTWRLMYDNKFPTYYR